MNEWMDRYRDPAAGFFFFFLFFLFFCFVRADGLGGEVQKKIFRWREADGLDWMGNDVFLSR